MKGVNVAFDATRDSVELTINPAELPAELEAKALYDFVLEEGYGEVYISYNTLKSACDKANHFFKTQDKTVVSEVIGERRHAEVEFRLSEDNMSATLILTAPFGGKTPNVDAIATLAKRNNIRKGLGKKRIAALLTRLDSVNPGDIVEGEIAKGLPARDGRSSHFAPLVPNALERILRPQQHGTQKVDMRNLGEVICVKANTPVLRREVPGTGRTGFDVTGKRLEAKIGDWVPFKMGTGTAVSDDDENLLVSTISGMPKYQDQTMTIDDTFICQGVNVGTGHVNYNGAVLVNGDVTEKMIITATGDVTVNGFVESAQIEAGGDIIITEGAMGKVNDSTKNYSCTIKATGNVHVQHGQGLDIQCAGNVTIGRQLAYSRLRCGGSVTVGQVENPQGNLFACEITSQGPVSAGTVGAVSGSTLKIDFSPGYNQLQERKDTLDDLQKQLRQNTSRHKQKIDIIKKKLIPQEMRSKVDEAVELLKNETALLSWIEMKSEELKLAKDNYQNDVKLIANKRLYSGVTVKLNNRNWRSDREYDRSSVRYEGHQWIYDPIV